jgi:hypothetical protein
MKTTNQIVFNNLMQKLNIKPAPTNVERFNEWMKKTVKSIHYTNNEAMTEAYKRIIN